MATKLYLREMVTAEDINWGIGGVPVDPEFWDAGSLSGSIRGYAAYDGVLGTSPGSVAISTETRTIAGPVTTDGLLFWTGGVDSPFWASRPLAAGFTLSGTVTFNLWAFEVNSAYNAQFVARLYKLDTGGALTLIVTDSVRGAEFGTSLSAHNWTASPSSTAFAEGDRIVLWAGITDAPAVTMGSSGGLSGVAMTYEGPTGGADGDSWVQVNENVTFKTTAPTGTQMYLRSTVSDITGESGVDRLALSTTQGSSAQTAVRNTVTGPVATASTQWTISGGGDAIEWYTPTLEATTLSGVARVCIHGLVSSGSAFGALMVELAVVDYDGSDAVVWGRSMMFGIGGTHTSSYRLATTRYRFRGNICGPDRAITLGQRIRLRVYLDETNAPSVDPLASGFTATIAYNGNTEAATTGASSDIVFPVTLDEYSPVAVTPKLKRIIGPGHLGNTPGTTLYTVPIGGAAWIRHILVTNPTGSSKTVTLSIGPDSAQTRVLDARVIEAGGRVDMRKAAEHWLNAGEVVQANASAASSCVIIVEALEYSI